MNIILRPIQPNDIQTINSWESYPQEFTELDYALRKGGWLNLFGAKSYTYIFAVKHDDELIGFSILSDDVIGTEFRIALRPDMTGKGFGKQIVDATIEFAFVNLKKQSVYLIVRLSNISAIKLYQRYGFKERGEETRQIDSKPIYFLRMQYDNEVTWKAIIRN